MFIFLTFIIWPAIRGIYISFFDSIDGRNFEYVGTANYSSIFGDPTIASVAKNTATYVVFYVAISTVLSLMFALVVNEQKFAKGFFRAILFLPVMLSPVVVGLIQGERPASIAYLGIALAAVAVALVGDALGHHDLPTPLRAIVFAFISGLGFGVIFVCLAQTSDDAGLWPLLGQRMVSVPTVAIVAYLGSGRIHVARRVLPLAVFSGLLDTTANGLYLLAIHGGMLSLVGVITALYPVSTVGLAVTLDKEKLHKSQIIGLVLAAISLSMVGYASNT